MVHSACLGGQANAVRNERSNSQGSERCQQARSNAQHSSVLACSGFMLSKISRVLLPAPGVCEQGTKPTSKAITIDTCCLGGQDCTDESMKADRGEALRTLCRFSIPVQSKTMQRQAGKNPNRPQYTCTFHDCTTSSKRLVQCAVSQAVHSVEWGLQPRGLFFAKMLSKPGTCQNRHGNHWHC